MVVVIATEFSFEQIPELLQCIVVDKDRDASFEEIKRYPPGDILATENWELVYIIDWFY